MFANLNFIETDFQIQIHARISEQILEHLSGHLQTDQRQNPSQNSQKATPTGIESQTSHDKDQILQKLKTESENQKRQIDECLKGPDTA